jgi:hypothetical protein
MKNEELKTQGPKEWKGRSESLFLASAEAKTPVLIKFIYYYQTL